MYIQQIRKYRFCFGSERVNILDVLILLCVFSHFHYLSSYEESELSTARELDSDEIPEDQDDIEKNSLLHVPEKPPKDEPCTPNSSTENGNDASADCPDNSVSGLSTSEDIDSETNVGNMELESDLGQFSDMLKWYRIYLFIGRT